MSYNSKLKKEVGIFRNQIRECANVIKKLEHEIEEEAKLKEEDAVVRNKVRRDAMTEAFRIHMDYRKQIRELELEMIKIHESGR